MEHKDLDIWKFSMDLVEEIYKLSTNFFQMMNVMA